MGNRIEKAVLLFVAANLADQKNGVEDDPGDDEAKEISRLESGARSHAS